MDTHPGSKPDLLPLRIAKRLYKRLRSTTIYNRYMELRIRRLTTRAADVALARDSAYVGYLKTQIAKSFSSTKTFFDGPPLNVRTQYLVGKMEPYLAKPRGSVRVLCVGCRNSKELDYIESTCGVQTKGLDLFSEDPRVVVGDMHKMPFKDGEFDAIYSCHSLEHSYNHERVLSEYVRVTKPSGLITIEVPVAFEKNESDYKDFGNAEALISAFGPHVARVLWSENAVNAGNATKKAARVVIETSASR